jgi:hypothetical protein
LALFHPDAPTLSVIGTDHGRTHDELEIHPQGDKVWTIDSLQFGLDRKQVWLLDVVVPPDLGEDE